MFRKIIAVFLSSILIFGCANQKLKGDNNISNSNRSEGSGLILLPATYSDHVSSRVIDECSMLTSLNDSIVEFSDVYALDIEKYNGVEGNDPGQKSMQIEFSGVKSHEWHWTTFFIKPGSVAMAKISILQDGKVIDMARKRMRTSMSFSSCSRLEKIARVGGKFAVKWALRKGY